MLETAVTLWILIASANTSICHKNPQTVPECEPVVRVLDHFPTQAICEARLQWFAAHFPPPAEVSVVTPETIQTIFKCVQLGDKSLVPPVMEGQ